MILALLVSTSLLSAQEDMDYQILIENIEFQPGVTIDINVNVYVNENATNNANHGKIFAVEGMAHTANCLKPLAEELFLNSPATEINEFFAIDMPGRGGSGVPVGLNSLGLPFLLDQMYIEDYLAVIEASLAYLNDELNIKPTTIMGHSLGGMEVVLLQNKLLEEGSSLRKKYQIKNAVLLAPGIPAPLDWAYVNGGGSGALFAYVDYFTPEYGTILNIPDIAWPYPFFSNTGLYPFPSMVPGAPTAEEVIENGYNGIEPAPLLLQISGTPIPEGLPYPPGMLPYPFKERPSVPSHIFRPNHGVQLTIVCDEYDRMMTPDEEMILYEYLTGDLKHKKFFEVLGDETCHDTHISDPQAIVELLTDPSIFKNELTSFTEEIPLDYTLSPNPVIEDLMIHFNLPSDQRISIDIVDLFGRSHQMIQQEFKCAGNHAISLKLDQLPKGIYFCQLKIGNEINTLKMIKL